jgi:ubiquinone/menaquinone biosynthesis C-methylase UbiE
MGQSSSSIKKMLRILHLHQNLLQLLRPNPSRFYTYIQRPAVPGVQFSTAHGLKLKTGREPLWINLGYWRDVELATPDSYARWPELLIQAQMNLATLLAETAKLVDGDEVLDCGCGYGDQDILWLEKYQPRRIVGIEITKELVRVASERVRLLNFEDRVEFRHASATKIPFSPKTFDVVLALQCAFHFDTRETFLQEAARVLRPGGRIAIADMFCTEKPNLSLLRRLHQSRYRRMYHVPSANLWTHDEYKATLERLGFQDISIVSIAEDVFRPFMRQSLQFRSKHPTANRIRRYHKKVAGLSPDQFGWKRRFGFDEYAIVFARAS